jgi:mRNA interferase RelE/StbE
VAKYSIVIKKSAAKEIESIDSKKDRILIIEKISSLAENPRFEGALKLSNSEKYRIRQGNYRILYEINDEVIEVSVVKVGHRKEVYRKKS